MRWMFHMCYISGRYFRFYNMDWHNKLTPKYFNVSFLSADTRLNQFIFLAEYMTDVTNVTTNPSIALRK